jgi:hypothetical protein
MIMALPRTQSIAVGLGLAAVVLLTYRSHLPPVTDVKAVPPNDRLPGGSEKTARWTSAAVVGLVSLLTMDGTVFILGGTMVIIESWSYRHANMYDPQAKAVSVMPSQTAIHAADSGAGYTPSI